MFFKYFYHPGFDDEMLSHVNLSVVVVRKILPCINLHLLDSIK